MSNPIRTTRAALFVALVLASLAGAAVGYVVALTAHAQEIDTGRAVLEYPGRPDWRAGHDK